MIFVTLGTQKFQFNRLLSFIDDLIDDGIILDTVYAQIGNSDYVPKNYEFSRFMNSNEFDNVLLNSSVVVTHSGVGTILKSVKMGKKIIVVPRLAKYLEHVDDHQVEIAKSFCKLGYVLECYEKKELSECFNTINEFKPKVFIQNNSNFVHELRKILDNIYIQ